MSVSIPVPAKEPRTVAPPMAVPVPAPPRNRLAKPRAVQTLPSKGREHEVQRLIRDLAALAAKHRPSVS